MGIVDNHCCPYIQPSHCKDSHICSTLTMAANLTQILNFQANFHKEFELFKNIYNVNNGGHFKVVSIIMIKKNCPHKTRWPKSEHL